MKTKLLTFIAILGILTSACSKKGSNPTPVPTNNSTVKISLVSGNNQTAQIGYPLADSIFVKVTDNNTAAANYTVQFIGSGCNEDLITNATTKSDGTTSYSWAMAGNGGSQTLRAVVIQNGQRVDSVTVGAMASTVLAFPPRSACVPNVTKVNQYITGYAEHFVALSNGPLLACFAETTSIRYSDDNGATWNPLTGFGANHSVSQLAVTPQDGIFAATNTDGLFYSGDGGNTWKDVSPPGLNKQNGFYDINYTKSGKLIALSALTNVYVTANNGSTWTSSTGTGLTAGTSYSNPVELNNGDMYVISLSGIVFKSTDGGQNWTEIPNATNQHVSTIYCDNNGFLYEAVLSSNNYTTTIEVSRDNGTTFSPFTTYTKGDPYIVDMSVQSDGNFYFGIISNSIYQVTPGGTPNLMVNTDLAYAPYILTKSHLFLYGSFEGMYY